MGELRDAFEWVQERKDEPYDFPQDLREQMREKLEDELGAVGVKVKVPEELVDTTLLGMAWIARMCHEEGIDVDEMLAVVQDLYRISMRKISAAVSAGQMTTEQAIQSMAGAVGPTMLWVGLRLRRDGQNP